MTIRYGTSGDDTIVALQATDTLVGLEGNDIFDFDGLSGVTVLEEAGGGTDTILTAGDLVLPDFVENLILVPLSAGSLLTGNALANRIDGGAAGDTLDGAGGLDTLAGGEGGDIYLINDSRVVVIEALAGGADEVRSMVNYTLAANVERGFLEGGSAAITLTGNLLANLLVGNEQANVIDGGLGDDNIEGDTGSDTLRGGDGNDTVNGNDDNDLVDGGNGNDLLGGNAGNDRVLGGAGNDTLEGGTGRDTLEGGLGNDSYRLSAGDGGDVIVEAAVGGIDTVQVDASLLTFTAATGIEAVIVIGGDDFTLIGNAVGNTLVGGTGDDRIDALAGNDAIDGGLGADTMLGGLGNDQYTVDDAGDQVIEVAGAAGGSDRVFSSIASYVLPANVERLMLVAQSAAVTGVGNALDNTIDGNEADNRLEGGAGNDWLDGRAGADTLVGGTGNDTFVVDNAADAIVELSTGGLADLVRVAADITYTMADGVESALVVAPRAHVIGNRGANTITGGAGGDELDGGRGIDRLVGGTGDDTYVVDNTLDVIVEVAGAGIDTVFAAKDYTLVTNVERLVLLGSAGVINGTGSGGNDTITGNGSVNVLMGMGGNDELYGLGGNDNLQGGLGNDLLDGGTGANALSGGLGDDTFVVRSNGDTIADDGGKDLLVSHLNQVELLGYLGSPAIEDILLAEGASVRNAFGNTLANTITGNLQQNLLDGNAGNDFIDGAGGVDTLRGGAGDDTMRVSDVGDLVVENPDAGTDTIRVGFANYTLPTNVENLIFEGVGNAGLLVGNTLANAITGGSGNDSIDGGGGTDTLTGGAGNDTYAVDNAADRVVELAGGGIDTIAVSVNAGATPITVNLNVASSAGVIGALNVEHVTILGTGLYNITGSAADNILTGNGSVNVIVGGAGNDQLNGGGGADSMAGGTGDDTYFVGTGDGALNGQQPSDDIITELANGGRDVAFVTAVGDYLLPDFVEDLQGTMTATRTWTGNALVNAIDVTLVVGGADTIIAPGLGANDSVIVRGLTSGKLTVTDTDGTDFVKLVLSGGTSTLDLDTGVNDVRFELLSGTSAETVSFAANATVLVTGAGSLTLAGTIVANQVSGLASAYMLDDFTGTLTFGATAVGASDAIALALNDVQGALATSNTAIERFDLDSQGPVVNTLAIGGVSLPVTGLPGFSVSGETALDLTSIGTSLDVLLDGFSGSRLGLAAAVTGSIQGWTVRADGSATELAITAGGDANTLAINTTGTGGESLLALNGESTAGAITLSGNQGLTLLGVSGGTVASTMNGAGVVLRVVLDGATDFTVTSGAVDTELTGSAGADSFVFGSSLDSNDVVDGGAGTDDLTATLAATVGVEVTAVSLNIAAVEAVTLNVQGRYLVDADAMDDAVVTITGGAGTETNDPTLQVDNGSGVWNASAYTRRFTFTAAADADGVTVTGGTKVDVITGSAGDDIIDGKGGTGGTETGGEGADTFRFTTAPTGLVPRAITDFVSGTDRLELANEVMAALGVDGALNPALFVSYSGASAGTDALSGAGVLKYVTTTGTLYYDADGNGAGFALHLTTLSLNGGSAALAATDITVI